ncbi:MAG: hypothetical protein MUE35_04505 [Hydrogenophaga sp.]|jgi:hypothetical protein|nr:hypothetical protein [Hydrogenophaga sp.]
MNRQTPATHRWLPLAALCAGVLLGGVAHAAKSTKDIVIDRVAPPAGMPAPAPAQSDAMVVSVLVESPEGTLTPRSTDSRFRTGERFRVRVLTSRAGRIAFYNTNPSGVLGREPVWRGEVQPGLETISPRLALVGERGVDQLHVVLEPAESSVSVIEWLGGWLTRVTSGSKDIRLDVQNTDTATYLINQNGQGLVTTVSIAHR